MPSPVPPNAAASSPFVTHDPEFASVGNGARLKKLAEVDAHRARCMPPTSTRCISRRCRDARMCLANATRWWRSSDCRSTADASRSFAPTPTSGTAWRSTSSGGAWVVCEQGTRSQPAAIVRIERSTGEVTTLVESCRGLRLNSPNDVVARSDGTFWFTDPSYGFLQGFRPEPQLGDYVYRYDPRSRRLSVVADSFDKPNGLAFSPDQRTLYVADSGANQEPGSYHPRRPHHVKAFDVVDGRQLADERLCRDAGLPRRPQGGLGRTRLRVVVERRAVFSPSGDLLGEIRLPGAVNFTFGGRDRNVLYITADDAIWAAYLDATGPPQAKGA